MSVLGTVRNGSTWPGSMSGLHAGSWIRMGNDIRAVKRGKFYPIKIACTLERCATTEFKDCVDCPHLVFQRVRYTREVL